MRPSAGLLLHRLRPSGPEFLLAHPGGPLWARQDAGAWGLPKGQVEPDEHPLAAALREFAEETGLTVEGPFRPLPSVRQAGGKLVMCWLAEGDPDLGAFRSNTFEMEWPRRSGRRVSFPECDRVAWFDAAAAAEMILASQRPLIASALRLLGADPGGSRGSPPRHDEDDG